MSSETQVCCTCRQELGWAEFSRDKSKASGRATRCKQCHLAAMKKYSFKEQSVLGQFDLLLRRMSPIERRAALAYAATVYAEEPTDDQA